MLNISKTMDCVCIIVFCLCLLVLPVFACICLYLRVCVHVCANSTEFVSPDRQGYGNRSQSHLETGSDVGSVTSYNTILSEDR